MTSAAAPARPTGLDIPPLLGAFVAVGVLADADARIAARIGAIAGERDPAVLLGAAMALRAPRLGHVCVQLDRVAEHLAVDRQRAPTLGDAVWAGPTGSQQGAVQAETAAGSAASADIRADTRPVGAVQAEAAADSAADLSGDPDWPAPQPWREALAASALVRGPVDGATPLVLDGDRLYLDRYWHYERRLVERLGARAADPPTVDAAAMRSGLDALFGPADGTLDRQRLAAAVAALRRLAIIAGGPGTGKTYTVARILALLHLLAPEAGPPPRVALAAPTGKAAARLSESLREALAGLRLEPGIADAIARTPASTLHRLLGTRRDAPSRFRHDADNPLPHDVVIVDEASMVSLALMSKLVDAVRPDARLVLVGDRDQLASVEAGAVFGDVCGPSGSRPQLLLSERAASELSAATGQDVEGAAERADGPGIWDGIVRLDRFHRFGAGSGIGHVAAAIQRSDAEEAVALLGTASARASASPVGEHGEDGEGTGPSDDVMLLDPGTDPDARDRALMVAVEAYAGYTRCALAGADAREALRALARLRVLCAVRRGPDGVHAWNTAIEEALAGRVAGFRPRGEWYAGRPVLVTENDYGLRLHNGDVGVTVEDADRPGRLVVVFEAADGSLRRLSPARLPACETTFAMTIHKSQGSQFDHALVVLGRTTSPILSRELVYTALTRARERATLLATEEALRTAIARPIQRASGITPRLWPPTDPSS